MPLHPQWEAKYLAQIADGTVVYPRIDSEYGPLVPYSDEVHHLCYEIWAFQAARNAAQTERILCATLQERPHLVEEFELNRHDEIKSSTILAWIKKENWHGKADMELASIMPSIRRVAYRELALSVLPAIQALREITADTNKDHATANSVRTKSAMALLDRAGYGSRFDVEAPKQEIINITHDQWRDMSDQQVIEAEMKYLDSQATESG
jgi:hypothetical protein